MNIKKYWDFFSDKLGKSPIHPQFLLKRYEYLAVEEVVKHPGRIVIDIGCGRQPYKKTILSKFEKYIGVDHPEVSKKYMNGEEKPDILADATNLPFKDKYADCVSMISVLEHLPDPVSAIHEAYRITKSGGYFVGITIQNYILHDKPFDYFRYTQYSLKALLTKAGFKKVKTKPLGNFWELYLQLFNVYMLNKIKENRKLLILLPFALIFSLFNNLVLLIVRAISKTDSSGDFAIYNLVVGRR